MRRDHDVLHVPEWMIGWKRLDLEHIETGTRELASTQGLDQCVKTDDPTTANVKQVGSRLHRPEGGGVEQPPRLRRFGRADNEEIRLAEQVEEMRRWPESAHFWRRLGTAGIDCDHSHLEGRCPLRYRRADTSQADDAESAVGQVHHPVIARLPAVLELEADQTRNLAGEA